MKRHTLLLGLVLALLSMAAFAQTSTMDSQNEKNVHITSGPNVTAISGTTATLNWTTDKNAANHVKYRTGGGAWKSAYTAGGSTNHSVQLTGLQPGQTIEYQILTRDGDVRTSGQFQTAATATGTAPDVNASSTTPGATAPTTPGSTSGAHVPVYRLDGSSGAHAYTTTNQVSMPGFTPIGTAFFVASSQEPGTVPLYKLQGPNGDNVLTTSTSEKSQFQARGYQDQGILGYVASSQEPGTVPLTRMSDSKNGMHLYTAQQADVSSATSQGYHVEQTQGYVWQQ